MYFCSVLWKYGFAKSSDNLYAPCIVWYTCSVNTTMGRAQECVSYELVGENANDVKVSLLIFVMS